jgi:hypothetical protein
MLVVPFSASRKLLFFLGSLKGNDLRLSTYLVVAIISVAYYSQP